MLDQPLHRAFRIILIFILLCLPFYILIKAHSEKYGFLDLILFGQIFSERQLDVVKQVDPEEKSPHGYDGQFYAQLALDPLLLEDETVHASDGMAYFSRRIGLPFLSYIAGIGNPYLILQIYALSNFAFWLLLLWMLYRVIGLSTLKHFLLVFALLWTSGTLTSLSRALLDLPSAVLALLATALVARPYIAATIFSYAVLIRETTLVSIFALLWPEHRKAPDRRLIIMLFMICIPFLLWLLYIRIRLSSWGSSINTSFGMPFASLYDKFILASKALATRDESISPGMRIYLFWEILGPASLTVQSLYLFIKPRFYAIYWRLGIGYAAMLYLVTMPLLVEQYAYSRIFLLLTFSFNLLLYKYEHGKSFLAWYLAGNIGLAWVAIRIVV